MCQCLEGVGFQAFVNVHPNVIFEGVGLEYRRHIKGEKTGLWLNDGRIRNNIKERKRETEKGRYEF